MSRPRPGLLRLCVALGSLAVALSHAAIAAADAIPPAPTDCPSGHVGVTSHSGPACVKEPPDDCPAGWRGVVGGKCMLTPCTADQSCRPGEACVEHSVCLQPFEDGFYEYGEEPPGSREETPPEGAAVPPLGRELLGGPPAPQVKRPKPIFRYDAVNLCTPSLPCAAPRTCQTEKLCVPRGQRAVAYRGDNVSHARVARLTEEPLTESGASSSEALGPPPKGGCAACAMGASRDGHAWVLLFVGIAVTFGRRAGRARAASPAAPR